MSEEVVASPRREPIVQFSLFADNKVGRLNELIFRLDSRDIHPLALTVQDTTDCSVIRMVVDQHEAAKDLFPRYHYAFSESQVVAVEMRGALNLKYVTAALLEAEINIHYVYPFLARPEGNSALVFHLEDNEMATQVLCEHQIRVLTRHDLTR